jgi:hypothetical protein
MRRSNPVLRGDQSVGHLIVSRAPNPVRELVCHQQPHEHRQRQRAR